MTRDTRILGYPATGRFTIRRGMAGVSEVELEWTSADVIEESEVWQGAAAAGDIDVSVKGRRRLAEALRMPTAILPFWRRFLLLIRCDIV